jgi:predicted dehydrogenase
VRYIAVCHRTAHNPGDGGSLYCLADTQSQSGAATFTSTQQAAEVEDKTVTTEDAGSVLVRFDDGSKGCFSVSQVSAGRKNRLSFEVNGSECSLGWDQEVPQQLWIGHRQQPNQILTDDPGLMSPDVAASAHFPAGISKAGRMRLRI